jgi:hypothetical protein
MQASLSQSLRLLVLGGLLARVAGAQFPLSEVDVNPPGTDQGQEAVEIRGAPGASLSGYYLLAIEGDGTGAGVVD